jgi:type I restriction enzyme M protein
VLFVPEIARLSWLVTLPEGEDLGANIDLAMDAVEATNTGLRQVLPQGYQKLEKSVLLELVRLFAPLPRTVSGDAFGLIYEYFLSEFAANEGRRGGEFFTPQSIVRLIVARKVVESVSAHGVRIATRPRRPQTPTRRPGGNLVL